MTEHSFIRAIHRKLPKEIYTWKIHDTYAGGIPDAFYAGPAGILFVEYKYVKNLPAKESSKIPFKISPLQIQWLENAKKYPFTAVLVVGCEKSGIILKSNFTNIISKQYYLANILSIDHISAWIAEQTLGRLPNGHAQTNIRQLKEGLET